MHLKKLLLCRDNFWTYLQEPQLYQEIFNPIILKLIMPINLTVILKSKAESIETFKSHLLDLVQNSKKEAACLQYDLHQSEQEPTTFIFHEVWENQSGLDHHNQQSYLQSFFENAKLYLQEAPIIYITNKLS
jgi:quinol monooxygenase YgiN